MAAAVAILIAVVVLFTTVFPSEYGFDPLGTGALLGLTSLSRAAAAQPEVTTDSAAPQPPAVQPADAAPAAPGPDRKLYGATQNLQSGWRGHVIAAWSGR